MWGLQSLHTNAPGCFHGSPAPRLVERVALSEFAFGRALSDLRFFVRLCRRRVRMHTCPDHRHPLAVGDRRLEHTADRPADDRNDWNPGIPRQGAENCDNAGHCFTVGVRRANAGSSRVDISSVDRDLSPLKFQHISSPPSVSRHGPHLSFGHRRRILGGFWSDFRRSGKIVRPSASSLPRGNG